MTDIFSPAAAHAAQIRDQFTRQAEIFAAAPELHNAEALALLTDAANPGPDDVTLDIACGPGSVVAAMAKYVRRAMGLDSTAAMLDQAGALATAQGIGNVAWQQGDVYALPYADKAFDIVTCRFAFHHFTHPQAALAEMVRVCRPGGVVLVCDALAAAGPGKAAAFNQMERLRDPSTVEFRPLATLLGWFAAAGLPPPAQKFFQVPAECEDMVERSFPANDDRAGLRRLIEASVPGDLMGLNARYEAGRLLFAYPSVILTAMRPG